MENEVAHQLRSTPWQYAHRDPKAVAALIARLAEVGSRGDLITYSDLVRDVVFHPQGAQGKPYQINVRRWSPADRKLIGDYLALISAWTYQEAGFFATALVIGSLEGRPGGAFFEWMRELRLLDEATEDDIEAFWVEQVKKAHAWFRAQAKATWNPPF